MHLFQIFLIIVCFFMAVILFARLSISLNIKNLPTGKSLSARIYWMHPSVLRAVFDLRNNVREVLIFGRFRISFPREPDQPVKRQETIEPISPTFTSSQTPVGKPTDDQASNVASSRALDNGSSDDQPFSTDSAKSGAPDVSTGEKKSGTFRSFVKKIRAIINTVREANSNKVFFFIRHASWRTKILRWLQGCLHSIVHLFDFQSIDMHLRAGFSDPSLTGKLFGYWTGVQGAIAMDRKNSRVLNIEPVFTEECLDLIGSISVRSSLMRFIAMLTLALATFPYLSTWLLWRAAKR
jgi:hypothetical protein